MQTKMTGFSLRLNDIVATALVSGTLFGVSSGAAPAASTDLSGSVTAEALAPYVRNVCLHDPSTLIKCKDEFWVFATGNGVPSWHSKDLVTWQRGPAIFTGQAPPWVAEAVPANGNLNFWAPDVTYMDGALPGRITRLRLSERAFPASGWSPRPPLIRAIPLTAGRIREWWSPRRRRMISIRLIRRSSTTPTAVFG